jgi:hypothetical protein
MSIFNIAHVSPVESTVEIKECRLNAAVEAFVFSSFGCNFDVGQLLRTRPSQLVVG